MISHWFQNPHKLHRPYNFSQVREVSAPQRRGLSALYGMDGLGDYMVGQEGPDATQLPIYVPGVDYTPDILSSSWMNTLATYPTGGVTRFPGGGIPNPSLGGGISPMMIGLGLLTLILVSGGHR